MKSLRNGSRLVLAFLLALSVAGSLCAPVSALAAIEIDVTSVTNRYFNDYDDYLEFRDAQYEHVTNLISVARTVTNGTWSSSVESGKALSQIHLTQERLSTTFDETSDPDVRSGIASAQVYLGRAETFVSESYDDSLDAYYRSLSDLSTLESVKRSIEQSDVPTYQIVVEQSSGGGGVGCSCPDYTTILNAISSSLTAIQSSARTIQEVFYWFMASFNNATGNTGSGYNGNAQALGSTLGYFFLDTSDGFYGFLDSLAMVFKPNAGNYYEIASEFGFNYANVISNLSASIDALNVYPQYGMGIFNDVPVTTGPAFVQEMWNYILRPYAMLMADTVQTDNTMINGFRDFYAGPAHTVYPTNSYQHPLWVNMMTNGIGGSTEHPIFVEVTTGPHHESVSVDNPVWVQFTNSVHIDASDVINVAFTNNAGLEVNFDELIDAMNDLTNATWKVFVVNSNDLANALLDEEEQRINQMEDDLDDEAEPDKETQELPGTSFGFADSVTRSYKEVLTSYKNMFDAIPSDPPYDITIWQGGNYGDVEIQSLHWRFSEHSTLLRHCRNLFSFGWYVVYVFVVFVTAAIDLCVCGVIVYMVYGLFLGKPDVAYHGMLWCFKTLATFFGYKPQSVK